ncbi:Sec-independent protein translocase subunit TatA [Catenulispora rubra]|uniref:Sec-independent protein translocase subunit TatA n=1 Tax=Catenulispora rubra TaxID=280293 RepID=UPI0018925C47|nr:Sec-independent protein translocase subunit TatA [Catenulispora rubra]
MFGELQPWHVIVLLVILFLLFGAKKMPDMARSVGQSLRIFKSEMRQSQKETEEVAKQASEAARVTPPAVENVGTPSSVHDEAQKQANAS